MRGSCNHFKENKKTTNFTSKRGQIKRIIEETMRLAGEFGGRDKIHLQEIYRIAEIVKGDKINKKGEIKDSWHCEAQLPSSQRNSK